MAWMEDGLLHFEVELRTACHLRDGVATRHLGGVGRGSSGSGSVGRRRKQAATRSDLLWIAALVFGNPGRGFDELEVRMDGGRNSGGHGQREEHRSGLFHWHVPLTRETEIGCRRYHKW